ncbi:NAD(P)/FAD-dependent oxidoreductase [Candidatus Spongiihabitans sp.]|uniref:NAD(P)/FAD-dependent oxidoreductase n=1 Tax=Candidatus Spongiihabitans sp. TaxID=3101308 RepID=UPI003C6F15A6
MVGPRDRESGASQAAGAMLGCFGEVTTETLCSDAGRTRFEIGVTAHDHWDTTLQRLEEASPVGKSLKVADDTYVILNSIGGELDSDNFSAIVAALNTYEKPWTDVDAHDILGFNPRTDCRVFRAIHLPTEGSVDARGVLAALETRLQSENVPVIDQTVRKIRSRADKVTGVELHDGSIIEADIVVVAAGARSEELIHSASDDLEILPTFPGLGLGMIAKRSRGKAFRSVVRTPNRGFACGLHVVPQGDGREYIGSTNRIVQHVMNVVWLEDVRYLAQYAMQQLDEEIAHHQIEQFLRGNRPITLDGFPLVGWLPLSGLYLMTGTYRDGLHSAPLLATHIANELLEQPGTIDPMFKPTREPIVTRTIEHSIEEYAHHSIATWYETGADSSQMPTKDIYKYYRDNATKLYDELGINYALGPDVLWYAADDTIGSEHIKRYLLTH